MKQRVKALVLSKNKTNSLLHISDLHVCYEFFSYRYRERGNIEAQCFNIRARLKANGQKLYVPPEGKLIHDIESSWLTLEKCEHGREVALKDELIRQERLEQLARRFARKVGLFLSIILR